MNADRWEHFRHEADMGVRGFGGTMAQAFEQAAVALTAVITNPTNVAATRSVEARCQADDPEILLFDWLNAVVLSMATRHMLFSRYEVRIEGDSLAGKLWGETVEVERHEPAVEVKGATFTELKVARTPDGRWLAQCVVDV